MVTVAVLLDAVAVVAAEAVGDVVPVGDCELDPALPEGVGSAFAPLHPASTSVTAAPRAAIRAVA
jgi:hypothetical protein